MKRRVFIRILVVLAGLGLISVSLFAFQLGLDNNLQMGRGRWAGFMLGLAVILFGSSYWLLPILETVPGLVWVSRLFQTQEGPIDGRQPQSSKITDYLFVAAWLLAIIYYLWVIGAGRFFDLPKGKNYYGLLSDALLQGQTSLLVTPSAELLALENPYDLEQRKDVDFLWDITLYDGKYYLYWGPAPAVLGALFSWITSRPATDAGLVLTLISCTALFSLLLLRKLNQDVYMPVWVLWGTGFVLLANIPLIWMLTRPKYYEVATAGGMCFIVTGLYFFYAAFQQTAPKNIPLALASLSFGLAAASRMSLIPGIAYLVFLMAWKVFVGGKNVDKSVWLRSLASAFLPIAVVAGLLASYNYVRFGSMFEFGFTYTLTGPTVSPLSSDVFSPRYAVPNFYTYFFRAPSVSAEFPFVRLDWIRQDMWPSFITIAEGYYYTDPVAGILLIIPLVGLTFLFTGRVLWRWINGDQIIVTATDPARSLFWALLGYSVIQTCVLLVFIASNVRYLVDISQVLIFLGLMFFVLYFNSFAVNEFQRKLTIAFWSLASLATVIMGLLIGLTGDKNLFLNQNPQLYAQLQDWFTR